MKYNKRQALLQLGLLLAIFVALNVLSANVYQRFDLTKEKRFTLTDATKNLISNLDDVIYVKVYLEGEFPAGFKRLQRATYEMLNEFRAYSGNNIEYEFIDPLADAANVAERAKITKQLVDKGLSPTRLVESEEGYSEKLIFPAALIVYKGRELAVTLLQEQLNKGPQETLNNSIALLEYNLANAIQKLQRPSKPAIAFLEGHGEWTELEVQDIAAYLSNFYVLQRFNLQENLYIPPKFSAIVIAQPTEKFEESNKFKIDQYLMNGGKALWVLENMRTHLDSLQNATGSFLALDYGLNLDDMLFKYGVRINPDLVQDLQCTKIPLAIGVDKYGNATQMRLYNWMYSPVITRSNPEHPVSKNLNAVLAQFVGTIDTIQTKANIQKDILLKTSDYSRPISAPIKVDVNDVRRPNQSEFNEGERAIAVALEGEFVSAFKNRLAFSTQQMLDTLEDVEFREMSLPNTRMVVISDGDFIRNDLDRSTGKPSPLGYYKYTKETFANKDFILNAIEWLTDENGIIEARSKDIKLRLLDEQKVKNEKGLWQLFNIVCPLLLVLVFAAVYSFWRKRKFAIRGIVDS